MGRPTSSMSADSAANTPVTRSKRSSSSSASPDELDNEPASHGSRPKRRATNPHIFRYLQHGNPNRLQDRDLKRALEASLEECQDSWPAEDTASCSSSDQSNAPSASSSNSESSGYVSNTFKQSGRAKSRRDSLKRTDGCQDCNCSGRTGSSAPSSSSSSFPSNCPIHQHGPNRPKVQKRFRPVVKKMTYSDEVDFFHPGIIDYITYVLECQTDDADLL